MATLRLESVACKAQVHLSDFYGRRHGADRHGRPLGGHVHAWYEDHIEGEEACPGSNFRARCASSETRGWVDPDMN
jgi:hypothetical protein